MTTPSPRPLDYIQSWPTVVFLVAVLATFVGLFSLADPTGQAVLLGILGVVGTAGAAIMRAAFGAPPPAPPKRLDDDDDDSDIDGTGGTVLVDDGPPTRPLRPTRVSIARNTLLSSATTRDDLARAVDTLTLAEHIRVAGVVLTALLFVGCAPSALKMHATTALVASQTLATTETALIQSCAIGRDSCADAACVERVHADCIVAATAQDAATDAVRAYIGAVSVASIADEGRVMAALMLALDTAARAWDALGEALEPLGVSLPALGTGGPS